MQRTARHTAAAAATVIAALATLTFGVTAQAAETCGGHAATKVVTDLDSLPNDAGGTYFIGGTPLSDTVVVKAPVERGLIVLRVDFDNFSYGTGASSKRGGTDSLCMVLTRTSSSGIARVSVNGGSRIEVSGADTMRGENDSTAPTAYVIKAPSVYLDLGSGKDNVSITTGTGAFHEVVVETGAGDDTVTVNALDARPGYCEIGVDAGPGNDIITVGSTTGTPALVVGGTGEDTIASGSGHDLIYTGDPAYPHSGYTFYNFVRLLHDWDETGDPLERVDGLLDPRGSSDLASNTVNAGGGNDRVYGSDGYDEIRTGAGNDWADGGGGRDRLWGGDGDDLLRGGSGDDDAYGEKGDDVLYGGKGRDLMKGGSGEDIVRGEADDDSLYGNEDGDDISGSTGNDTIYGNDHNDYLRGNDGDDYIEGNAGTDDCSGGAGTDTLKSCNP